MSDDVIELLGLRNRGRHGVLASERAAGQDFIVDLRLHLPLGGLDDDLRRTVDYSQIAREVAGIVTGPPVDLIETLAERIANAVLVHDRIRSVEVTVHKPQAPIDVPFTDVMVRIERHQAASDGPDEDGGADGPGERERP